VGLPGELGDATHFPDFRGDEQARFSEMGELNYTKFSNDIKSHQYSPKFVLVIRYVASFQNWSAPMSNIRTSTKFDILDPL